MFPLLVLAAPLMQDQRVYRAGTREKSFKIEQLAKPAMALPAGTYTFTVIATKSGLTLEAEHDIVVQLLQI